MPPPFFFRACFFFSRSYRAPEVVLGLPYGAKIDVVSLLAYLLLRPMLILLVLGAIVSCLLFW